MGDPIDMPRARRALAALKRHAVEHPEAFDRLDATVQGVAAMLEQSVDPKQPADKKAGTVVAVRLEQPVLDRLDAIAAKIQAGQPYLRVKRSDALRLVILEGLDRLDAEQGGR